MKLPTFDLLCGDSLTVLSAMPAGFVQCCVTSVPYWMLRDYEVEGQIGLEPLLSYVDRLARVFDEVRRVLTDDGVCWLNIGDSYIGSGKGGSGSTSSLTNPKRAARMNLALFDMGGRWHQVRRDDPRARALADRHYSRQTVGAKDFMASGITLVLLTDDDRAVWGCIENLDPVGNVRWRCSIFRNEGAGLSSELVLEATRRTVEFWERSVGGFPVGRDEKLVWLTTEIDPEKTRRKRDPGRCFRKAGWREVDQRRRLVILEAPQP